MEKNDFRKTETWSQTDCPNKTRPWIRYYEERQGVELEPGQKSIYRHFKEVAAEVSEELVYIDYLSGKRISYSEMLNEVDSFAAALFQSGITKNSTVGLFSLNSCVEPVVMLGTNKVGATLKFIDLDLSIKGLAECLNDVDLLVLEDMFAEAEPAINTKNIPVVIYNTINSEVRGNCILYSDFIKKGELSEDIEECDDNNKSSIIIFSSGTTGAAKPIVHSNKTIIAAVEKMLFSDFPINRDNMLVKVIPSHIGLGSITTMLTSIISGTTFINIRGGYNIEGIPLNMIELLKGYKEWLKKNNLAPEKGILIFASPFFSVFILNALEEIGDLSMIKGMLYGGSKMDKEYLDKLEKAFSEKGYNAPICNGYGQNEMAGAVALNSVHFNKNGSAGYPTYKTQIRIIDRETHEDVPFNKIGLIVEQSESLFLYYNGMPEKTEKSKIILPDGTEWFNSTDLGYMDEDGFVYVTGRTTRVILRTDHKISLEVIESKLKKVDYISDAAVIAIEGSELLFAFVSLKDKEYKNEDLNEKLIRDAELSELVIRE